MPSEPIIMQKHKLASGAGLLGLLILPASVSAAEAFNAGHTAWMLVATALVLLMTIPGLALFYGGMVRKENAISSVSQVFAITAIATLVWMVCGYSLAFTEGHLIGGLSKIFLHGVDVGAVSGAIPESVFMMFQMTFAIITASLITGGFAERMRFAAVLVFTVLWLLIVYIPVAHWVWGPGGWLGGLGVLDYAGGTVVHINSGVAGLVAAVVVGKRRHVSSEHGKPHNLVLTMVGASLLWVGWFGFNAGSALMADGRAGMAMVTTQIATAAATMSWMFAEWVFRGKPTLLGLASGAVAGLVAITPGSGFVGPAGALVIGLGSGLCCFWSAIYLKNWLGYDDALDAFGVHGMGGIFGALLTGVFAIEAIGGTPGLLEGNPGLVGLQAFGVMVTVVYDGVLTWVILKAVDALIGLRVTEEEEFEGLDINQHGEQLYD